jgi:hypothetical protein
VSTTDVVSAGRGAMTRRAIDTLREQLAPKASDDELNWLAAVGQRLGLDPIAGHLVLIPRWDARAQRDVHRPQITADGRLVLAERTGELDGFDGPQWTGARDSAGVHHWVDLWDDDEPPHAARCIVYRRGRSHPANGTVRWKEFAQWTGPSERRRLVATWQQMPSHMLGKVALSLGLRRAFGDAIPADVDIDDDFAIYERAGESPPPTVDRATGEILDATPPAQPQQPQRGGDGFGPLDERVASIARRAEALPAAQRQAYRSWKEARRLPWPTEPSAVLRTMDVELARLEAEVTEEADTYGGTPGGAPSPDQPPAPTAGDEERGGSGGAPNPSRPRNAGTPPPYEPPIGSPID